MIFKTPIILRDLKDPFITDHILPRSNNIIQLLIATPKQESNEK